MGRGLSIRRRNWKRWGALTALYLLEWILLLIMYVVQVFLFTGFVVCVRLQLLSWPILVGFIGLVVLILVFQRWIILDCQKNRAHVTRVFSKKQPSQTSDNKN
ncbi:hypothetical protein MCOL2_19716 [Listeria fleischmannii FSL S10-1203]|uniref:Uncharacterized protein n=1 Tax=Listeria fleischmannii FSL S10-1203 TaxID=1265822 RepID=W7CYN6_9LIST|nr:hypothetical protein MCOL2_19716 [Listeria fleischmannii FSL S10-1203]